MIKKKKFKLFFIIALCSAIIFYFYFLTKNKGSIKISDGKIIESMENNNLDEGITKFTDVEYKTKDHKNREYITKGSEAFVNKSQPDLIQLNLVHSFTILEDGTLLDIRSNKANYNKKNNNIKYYGNVKMTNKDVLVVSESASFIADKNIIKLENNVIIKDTKNTIIGDVAILNTISNNLNIFMKKNNSKVYGKRRQ